MEVKKDIKNELFGRREVSVLLKSDKTPSFAEVLKLLAEKFKASEENIMPELIRGKFGRKTFLIKACIYDTKEFKEEAMKRSGKLKSKGKIQEGKEGAEQPAQ